MNTIEIIQESSTMQAKLLVDDKLGNMHDIFMLMIGQSNGGIVVMNEIGNPTDIANDTWVT